MEITNRIGQRALTYVAAVTSQGYELSSEEFERYIGMPMPAADRAWADEAGQDGAEPVLDWLVRLGWLTRTAGKVGVTPLGRAVLRAVEQHELATELPPEVALGPAEPFMYGPVLGRIGDLRDPLLVDRTFQFDQLLDVMLRTSVTRILVGADAQYEEDRRRLAAALSSPLGLDRQLRVSVSAELHDRFVVPRSGPVGFLASTRNVLGHRHSIFGVVQPPAAEDIRRAMEGLWERATPLRPERLASRNAAAIEAEPPRPEPATVPAAGLPVPGMQPPLPPSPFVPRQAPAPAPVHLPPPALTPDPGPDLALHAAPHVAPQHPGSDQPAASADDRDAHEPDPWDQPRTAAAAPPPSPVTALRSLVSPLEGAALSGNQRTGVEDSPTRPAPPPSSQQQPILRPVQGGSRPPGEPILRPVADAPQRFGDPPGAPDFGQPPEPARFGVPPVAQGTPSFGGSQAPSTARDTHPSFGGPGRQDDDEPRSLPPPPWSPPNPWTPPSRGQSPFQRNDRFDRAVDDGPATQAWSAEDQEV